VMLPGAQPMSVVFLFPLGPCVVFLFVFDGLCPQLVTVNATRRDPPTPQARAAPRRVAAGAGAGGSCEGEEDQVARAPETAKRRVPAARAARALPSAGVGELVVGRGGGK
jgi:hypothetical protein